MPSVTNSCDGWLVSRSWRVRLNEHYSPEQANAVAWRCALAPSAVVDPGGLERQLKYVFNVFAADQKHTALKTLGATLYCAERFPESISRFEEAIQVRNGESVPEEWPFLAMAHHRLGHRDEARSRHGRLRDRKPSTDPNELWEELEIRLLRSEAEAVILYAPIFPADPFAH